MSDITSILDIYNEGFFKYNDRADMIDTSSEDKIPRTSHKIDKAIEDLALSPSIPVNYDGFLSQKEVRKKLFVADQEEGHILAFHGSDLEQESEDHCVSSPNSSVNETSTSLSSEKVGITMASDHSLTRVIAYHIYADQNSFSKVEEDIMQYV